MKTVNDVDLKNYNLIVSDIDGTLIGSDHVLSSYTKKTIFRLREEGFRFTVATGKNIPGTISQANELKIDLPLILINGGMLQTRQGEVLSAATLPPDVTKDVIRICDELEKDLVIYIDNEIYIKKMNENIYPIYSNVRSGLFEVGDWGTIDKDIIRANKCLVVESNDREKLIEMGIIFEKLLNDRADVLHASLKLVEVMPRGITKVSGISKLAAILGISMKEIMTFGDFNNDVEMLSAAGLGVAVENASPAAKAAADMVIGSVSEDGPAVFLNKLLDRCR
jgi:Cof subfamily protein (haloacid dehalogenase superfamily)